MAKKILVADDSSTIQKVVSITLSEEPFEIFECFDEKELFNLIEEDDFDLILLDVNLSEDKNGYVLAKEILKMSPESKIMLLLGTFDSISENLFSESGAHEKIIKPFDSKKFVQKCRDLIGSDELEEGDEEEYEYYDEDEEDAEDEYEYEEDNYEESLPNNNDEWVVNTVSNKKENPKAIQKLEENTNKLKLEKEIGDWGGDLPGIINFNNNLEIKRVPLPPKIQLKTNESSIEPETKEEENFPNDDDLGYPGEVSSQDENKEKPSFLSEDDLVPEDKDEDSTDPSFTLPKDLSKELEDEVDNDLSPDDFWAVDGQNSIKSEQVSKENIDLESENRIDKNDEAELEGTISEDAIEALRPLIKEMVEEYCKNTIERVAWEVIPDLAENLIKEELKEISKNLNQ